MPTGSQVERKMRRKFGPWRTKKYVMAFAIIDLILSCGMIQDGWNKLDTNCNPDIQEGTKYTLLAFLAYFTSLTLKVMWACSIVYTSLFCDTTTWKQNISDMIPKIRDMVAVAFATIFLTSYIESPGIDNEMLRMMAVTVTFQLFFPTIISGIYDDK